MATRQKWIVCEQSGRWSAAIRVGFSRLSSPTPMPRLYEVRTLGELSTSLDEDRRDLALIEVGPGDLTEVLQLLVRRRPQLEFVALLNHSDDQSPAIADLLWEMGAREVVESPRRLGGLLCLQNRLLSACGERTGGVGERQSFADWAWSTVPWQEP